jgi:hypothetical protein
MSQDIYAVGFSHGSFTYAYPAIGGVYAGKSAIPLLEHPHLGSGQTIIQNRKATGTTFRVAGTGFEYQQGHQIPATSWKWDMTAHNMAQILKSFFGSSGYTATNMGTTGYLTYKPYRNPNPDRFLTLVRKFSQSSADSHRTSGVIATSIAINAQENQAVNVTVQFMGRAQSYNYTWTPTSWHSGLPGDDDSFDDTLDPLLWKDANVAIGTVYEGGASSVATASGNTVTIYTATGTDLSQMIEPGSYIVFGDTAANKAIKYGPIATISGGGSGTVTLTLDAGTGPATAITTATANFKIINFFHAPGIDLTITNNAVSKAYDEQNIERHIYGDLTGSGTLKVPYSEIPSTDTTSTGFPTSTPGFQGSKWLNMFKAGGVVRFWIWWGDAYDCVLDSTDNGDFGMAFNIRATGDGVEEDNTEMSISVPFELVGTRTGLGSISSKAGVSTYTAAGTNAIQPTGSVDWVALGTDILVSSGTSAVGVHRGDTLYVQGYTSPYSIRYVSYTNYLYATGGNLRHSGAYYYILGEAVTIQLGVGAWNTETATL